MMGLHVTPFEERMEPPEYDDALDRVEFPRERKPWKRDRHSIRYAMQGAINRRCWANIDPGAKRTRDHSERFRLLSHARYEIWRHFFLDHKRQHSAVRAETVARLRRYVLAARDYDKPRLP
jgi:hypothetical protein